MNNYINYINHTMNRDIWPDINFNKKTPELEYVSFELFQHDMHYFHN